MKSSLSRISLALLAAFSSTAAFADYATPAAKEFCSKVPTWPKKSKIHVAAKDGQPLSEEQFKGVLKTLSLEEGKDLYGKEKVIFVDTRKGKDRKVGKIPNALLMTANAKKEKKNKVTESNLFKKLNKASKKGKIAGLKSEYKSVSEMADLKFVVFCNGRKCHRSSFGACELLKMGLSSDQVYVMLDGFPGWQGKSYPVK